MIGVIGVLRMQRKPISIRVIEEGDERFLLQTFTDGTEEKTPIVKLPRNRGRAPYRKVTFDKTRKKGF